MIGSGMPDISNTGERILLDKETPLMIARHFCAYKFAKDLVSGKSVLDIGCGEGYGSHYLAGSADKVTGMDYDPAVIGYAEGKYKRGNLTFLAADIKGLGSLGDKFDVVCCFQVIEHLKDAGALLNDVRSVLNPAGIFICSTPNKLDASPGRDKPLNKFHVKEYHLDEFAGLMKSHFGRVDMFGLKRGRALNLHRRLKKTGIFNFLPDRVNPVKRFYAGIHCGNFILTRNNIDTALDFIAVCAD